jgi:hypothetical protein
MDDRDDGAETDRALERGRLSIKNEEEEEEYYQRAGAGPSNARPTSRNGVSPRGAGPSLAGGTSVGGTLAAGLVAKARDRRLGKPAGSGEYPASELDDRRERERVLRLQRELSMKEREARRAKSVATASIAGGKWCITEWGFEPCHTHEDTPCKEQSQTGATTAGRGTTPPQRSRLRSLREGSWPAPRAGHYAVLARSGLAVPVLDLVRVW